MAEIILFQYSFELNLAPASMMYFQVYGYQLHKLCWCRMNYVEEMGSQERLHKLQPDLVSKHTGLFVVLLLVSCYLHVTSEPRATHMPVFYGAKWMSDERFEPTAKTYMLLQSWPITTGSGC